MADKYVRPLGGVGRPLTPLQGLYVDAFYECDGKFPCIAKKIDRSLQHAISLSQAKPVCLEIMRRAKHSAKQVGKMPDFMVSKPERLELLWDIAKRGVELIYDREGNEVMASPATSVSAVRTINEMLPNSLAPKEIDISIQVEDKRNAQEVRDSIQALTAEYTRLAALEGVTEEQVSKTRELPDIEDV